MDAMTERYLFEYGIHGQRGIGGKAKAPARRADASEKENQVKGSMPRLFLFVKRQFKKGGKIQ